LDQTDLNQRLILHLKGGGGTIREPPPDWLQGVGARPKGWGGRLGLLLGGPLPLGVAFLSLLFCTLVFSLYVNLTCGPSMVIFSWHPIKTDIHKNSWNSIN
jgi:hypothetical protein